MQPYGAHLPGRGHFAKKSQSKPQTTSAPIASASQTTVLIRDAVTVGKSDKPPSNGASESAAKPRPKLMLPSPARKKPTSSRRAPNGLQQPSAFSRSLSAAVAGLDEAVSGLQESRSKQSALKRVHAADGVLLDTNASGLQVGCCKSALPSRVKFLVDAVVYMFDHAQHGNVDMHMYYRDMVEVRCSAATQALVFRVKKKLAYFANEYDPKNRTDVLKIEFSNAAHFQEVERTVVPKIRAAAR